VIYKPMRGCIAHATRDELLVVDQRWRTGTGMRA
jgi:hypothetical protein